MRNLKENTKSITQETKTTIKIVDRRQNEGQTLFCRDTMDISDNNVFAGKTTV